jgi:hypothetical protein
MRKLSIHDHCTSRCRWLLGEAMIDQAYGRGQSTASPR